MSESRKDFWPSTRLTLLERVRDNQDKAAWEEFVALYGPLVFAFARRRLQQDDDAADVTQEVFAAFAGGTFDPAKGRFHKWLLTVILNKIRDLRNRRRRSPSSKGGTDFQRELDEQPADVEDEWEQDHRQRLLQRATEIVRAQAESLHWEAFRLSAVEGLSGKEIADRLQTTVSNVYCWKCRILDLVKETVEQFEGP